jgi:hypothetical protein
MKNILPANPKPVMRPPAPGNASERRSSYASQESANNENSVNINVSAASDTYDFDPVSQSSPHPSYAPRPTAASSSGATITNNRYGLVLGQTERILTQDAYTQRSSTFRANQSLALGSGTSTSIAGTSQAKKRKEGDLLSQESIEDDEEEEEEPLRPTKKVSRFLGLEEIADISFTGEKVRKPMSERPVPQVLPAPVNAAETKGKAPFAVSSISRPAQKDKHLNQVDDSAFETMIPLELEDLAVKLPAPGEEMRNMHEQNADAPTASAVTERKPSQASVEIVLNDSQESLLPIPESFNLSEDINENEDSDAEVEKFLNLQADASARANWKTSQEQVETRKASDPQRQSPAKQVSSTKMPHNEDESSTPSRHVYISEDSPLLDPPPGFHISSQASPLSRNFMPRSLAFSPATPKKHTGNDPTESETPSASNPFAITQPPENSPGRQFSPFRSTQGSSKGGLFSQSNGGNLTQRTSGKLRYRKENVVPDSEDDEGELVNTQKSLVRPPLSSGMERGGDSNGNNDDNIDWEMLEPQQHEMELDDGAGQLSHPVFLSIGWLGDQQTFNLSIRFLSFFFFFFLTSRTS